MVKVSVLVPIYNVEKYLEKCLESLCNQTLKEIEIICIDDGSTDKSRTILENFKERDQRIIVIEKVNTGYGNSMNIGLDKAIGKYIVIVESDDFVELDMVEKLYIEAEISKADVIKSNCFFYSENYKGERDLFINLFEDMPLKKAFCPIKEPRIFLKPQTIWSGIYVREFLLDNNIWFNETPGASYQDVSFSFQVLARASKIWLLPEAYYHYRTGNLNSSVKSPNKVFCICDEIDKIDEFIERQSQNKSILKWIESRLGYRVLMERYYGLASAFQYALFLKIVKYLEEYKKSGYITGEIWDKESIEEVDKILENPNKYFMDTAKSFEDERIVDEKSFTLNYSLYGNAVLKKVLESEKVIIYGSGQEIGRAHV